METFLLIFILLIVVIWKSYQIITGNKLTIKKITEIISKIGKIMFPDPIEFNNKMYLNNTLNTIKIPDIFVTDTKNMSLNSIIINGEQFNNITGTKINVIDDKIYVDDKLIKESLQGEVEIKFIGDLADLDCKNAIIHGNCNNDVHTNNLTCNNIEGDVDAKNITCKDIGGDVDTNNLTCNNIEGDVDADKVTANNITGNIDATIVKAKTINGSIDAEKVLMG